MLDSNVDSPRKGPGESSQGSFEKIVPSFTKMGRQGGVSMRILIVEDDAMFAFAIDDALSNAGHEIVGFARDEHAALDMATVKKPDLALVDLRLARDTSGAKAARSMRERHGIPSVFISSSPEDCRREAKASGALGCLSKPFMDQDLVSVVVIAEHIMGGRTIDLRPPGFELYPVE